MLPSTLKSFKRLTAARAKRLDVTQPTFHKKNNGFRYAEYFQKNILISNGHILHIFYNGSTTTGFRLFELI